MLSPDQYLGALAERIAHTGGALRQIQMGPVVATMALFTESVMLSQVNYCVVAAAVPDIDPASGVGRAGWSLST